MHQKAHPINDLSSRSHELDRLDPHNVLDQGSGFKNARHGWPKHSPLARNRAVPLRETASSRTNTIDGSASPFLQKRSNYHRVFCA
jgi:hypothetical protein